MCQTMLRCLSLLIYLYSFLEIIIFVKFSFVPRNFRTYSFFSYSRTCKLSPIDLSSQPSYRREKSYRSWVIPARWRPRSFRSWRRRMRIVEGKNCIHLSTFLLKESEDHCIIDINSMLRCHSLQPLQSYSRCPNACAVFVPGNWSDFQEKRRATKHFTTR